MMGELEGSWKDRVGKYRIIYKIDEVNKAIVLYDIDLRERVYQTRDFEIKTPSRNT